MSLIKTLSTSSRVLRQLRHDPRTIVLLFIIPSVLLTILKYVFNGNTIAFNAIAPMLLGIFPMIMMFLITSITTLRERRSGTLDRLLTMPMSKLDFIIGYALAFSFLALIQASTTTAVLLFILKVTIAGGTFATIIGAVAAAFLGTALGLFLSAFATSEFQAIQFMPAFLFPQLLVCGLFIDRSQMAKVLQWFADIMPLSYSVDAMKQVTTHTNWTSTHTNDLIVVLCFAIAALILGSITIKRKEKA
ncbi:MAG TPA: ABC transporter permease [Patescibacteria group bacterium]|nr:ABC transporter permease [Patescibacteria group bacterium]